jgi:hypothetical protein
MAPPYAFATLLTSDSYLPGALTLAAALKDAHPSPPEHPEVAFDTVCLVTPETVDVSSIRLLRRAYDVVVGVEIIEQDDDSRGLQLLGAFKFPICNFAIATGCVRANILAYIAYESSCSCRTPSISYAADFLGIHLTVLVWRG